MRYTEKKGVKRMIVSMLKSRSMSITAHSTSPLGYLIGISNQMLKPKWFSPSWRREGRRGSEEAFWGSDMQMDYDLVSPVGPSSGRECLGPADMDICVPNLWQLPSHWVSPLSPGSYKQNMQMTVIYPNDAGYMLKQEPGPTNTKVFPSNFCEPSAKYVSHPLGGPLLPLQLWFPFAQIPCSEG